MTIQVQYLKGIWQKSKGLLGATEAYPVMFTTRWGIHSYGLWFPIDVLILSPEGYVMSMRTPLPPNRFFFWNPKYYVVVELPDGYISRHHIYIGSKVSLVV